MRALARNELSKSLQCQRRFVERDLEGNILSNVFYGHL